MKTIIKSFIKQTSVALAVLLPASVFADLPYQYNFDNYDNWATQFTAGPTSGGYTNTNGAVDGKLRVSSSHIDYNGVSNNTRTSAYATNTGGDLNFYTQPIAITYSGVAIDFVSESGRPASWGESRRVAMGVNSRSDRFFFSSSTKPSTAIYLYLDDNGVFALAYNRNVAGDPNPPAQMSRPNIIESFGEAYSTSYEAITLTLNGTLDGISWGVSASFYDAENQLKTFSYSGVLSMAEGLWQGNGNEFYLSVGAEALSSFGAETSTISINSINVAAVPEPSSFAMVGALCALVAVWAVRRRRA